MRTLSCLATLLVVVALPHLAAAQPKAGDDKDKDAKAGAPAEPGAGTEVEMGDDDATPISDETGLEENPDNPGGTGDRPAGSLRKKAPAEPVAYPVELAQRPITLHAGMSEASLDYPVYFKNFHTAGQLRASYGITREIEIDLRYGIGSYSNDASKYFTGKSVALGGIYQVLPFVGVQLELPMLLDPFAMGVTVGAPLKFRFSKFALYVGRDLLTFKIAKFAPVVEDALATEALRAADSIGAIVPDGAFRILGGIVYTLKPNLSIIGETGFVANDFKGDEAQKPLRVGAVFNKKRFDYGARLSIDDLSYTSETLNVALFASLRI